MSTLYRRKPVKSSNTEAHGPDASSQRKGDDLKVADFTNQSQYGPGIGLIPSLLILLPVRILAALTMPITDCDEVFNYWEPTHQLVYGRGMQTWEYSPEFGLRSYLYVGLHALIIRAFQLVGIEQKLGKIAIFYGVRIVLGTISALCEAVFVRAVSRRFGSRVGACTLLFLAAGTGMFHASVSYLPQSFTMYSLLLCFSAWMNQSYFYSIFFMGVASLIGWPFSVLTGAILALEILYIYRRSILTPIYYFIISTLACVVPSLLVDYYYYRKWFLAVVNIAIYNKNASGEGSALYGVEPWSYYFKNLFLNWNVVFPLFLLSGGLTVLGFLYVKLCRRGDMIESYLSNSGIFLKFSSPAWIWWGIMTAMPHKEERFLFIIYPVIAFAAAFALCALVEIISVILSSVCSKTLASLSKNLGTCFALLIFAVLSASRTYAITHNYDAPFQVYSQLSSHFLNSERAWTGATRHHHLGQTNELRVCVGKEWYRFPSHFFLPEPDQKMDRSGLRLEFLKSEFDGLLPKHYARSKDATWMIPSGMNSQNEEVLDRYVELDSCDYIIDFELPTQTETKYSQAEQFEVIFQSPFLDASASSTLDRAFFLPQQIYTYLLKRDRQVVYQPYQLLAHKSAAKTKTEAKSSTKTQPTKTTKIE